MYNTNNMVNAPVPTKKFLVDMLVKYLGANEVVKVDDFETVNTRHICRGSKNLVVLSKMTYSVPTQYGCVPVEYFLCPNCRKLIINNSSLDVV